eukprot:3586932-Rhodomonas_salina.1
MCKAPAGSEYEQAITEPASYEYESAKACWNVQRAEISLATTVASSEEKQCRHVGPAPEWVAGHPTIYL